MTDVYDSGRLAAGYAFDRPPVHQPMLASVCSGVAARALDIGCGAGRSTAALAPYARFVAAVEPAAGMLVHRRAVAPDAHFAVGTAERLPYAGCSFDLVTAAGSLNYTDLDRALAEISRVLSADGTLVIYDFSEGRHADGTTALADWFGEFERRFPWPAGYRPLIVPDLPMADFGLELATHAPMTVPLDLPPDAYLRYVLSDVNVDAAIRRGDTDAQDARAWCAATLADVFRDQQLTVRFNGYVATVRHAAR